MRPLADIYDDYRCDKVFDHLRTSGMILVPGEGSPRPRIFIVGEAPGAVENTMRRPFVGASGRVLRSLITDSAEIDPTEWFITNVVKYRPPGNRTPMLSEINDSLPYLRAEYTAVGAPPVMVAVGAVAKQAIASHITGGILANSGKLFKVANGSIALWVMTHPAYALRNEVYRPTMEEHWEHFGSWFRKEFG